MRLVASVSVCLSCSYALKASMCYSGTTSEYPGQGRVSRLLGQGHGSKKVIRM